jgi:uncharacterized protein
MELTHRFNVPTSVEETWAHFNDIASVAECFPGAQVTETDGDSFSGSVKVKLGPIALVYNGSGTFIEKDEEAHRFVVDANGKDKRGNGTAGAKITASMVSADGGSTDVEVLTDLAITGKPAQFGRGVMQDVSDKLLNQFVVCLEARLTAPPLEDPPPSATTAGEESPASAEASTVSAEESPASAEGSTSSDPAKTGPRRLPPPPPQDTSLDLGAAVLPVILKSYWKQAAAAIVGLLILRKIFSRR